MPTKEDLLKSQRALYRISDAAQIAGTNPEDIVNKAHQVEIDFFYEAPVGLLPYCLAAFKKSTDLPIDIKTHRPVPDTYYIKATHFDYVALSRAQLHHILSA